jgi:hypothetical protein
LSSITGKRNTVRAFEVLSNEKIMVSLLWFEIKKENKAKL